MKRVMTAKLGYVFAGLTLAVLGGCTESPLKPYCYVIPQDEAAQPALDRGKLANAPIPARVPADHIVVCLQPQETVTEIHNRTIIKIIDKADPEKQEEHPEHEYSTIGPNGPEAHEGDEVSKIVNGRPIATDLSDHGDTDHQVPE